MMIKNRKKKMLMIIKTNNSSYDWKWVAVVNNDEIIIKIQNLIQKRNNLSNLSLSEKNTQSEKINKQIKDLKNILNNSNDIEMSQLDNDTIIINNNKTIFG